MKVVKPGPRYAERKGYVALLEPWLMLLLWRR